MNIAITGGYGFIGSNLVNYLTKKYPDYRFTVIDNEEHYAAHPENLESSLNLSVYTNIDINDGQCIDEIFNCGRFDSVIHLAAESHVDNSITDPGTFVHTNVVGTVNLLNAAKAHGVTRFYQISTDEVYGHLGAEGKFDEKTPYAPRSPYSASKAAADHLVKAYHETYGLPVVISNCSNNYGRHQDQEKLIPTVINAILNNRPIPVYGKGENVRDWLHVDDHCAAIDKILHEGVIGETYCVGGDNELQNIEIVNMICELMDEKRGGDAKSLISFVEDRKGHDFRYAINCEKLKTKLSWTQNVDFKRGLSETIDWYIKKHETQEANTGQIQE
ncbi:MAG: dTDP-glucose 4,6-dehydratase [bacterium]|nr:dTDP-glucose 4,6-dehydratase [bacterium]